MSFSENRVLGPIYTLVVKHQGARLPSIRVYHQQAVQVHKIVEDPVPLNSTPSIFCGLEDHTNHKWPMTIVWICFNPFVNGISHEERGTYSPGLLTFDSWDDPPAVFHKTPFRWLQNQGTTRHSSTARRLPRRGLLAACEGDVTRCLVGNGLTIVANWLTVMSLVPQSAFSHNDMAICRGTNAPVVPSCSIR